MILVTVARNPVIRPAALRDRAAGHAAIANYQESFRELDATARQLRDGGWDEGADWFQQQASIAYTAARAERRAVQEGS